MSPDDVKARTPLVFVPGFLCDARSFLPQVADLSAQRSVAVACPGARLSLAAMADAILETAPRRFAVAGHSMGGMVALEMVARAPERIERLALIDTNFLAESPAMAATRDVQIAQVKAGKLKRVLTDEIVPAYVADGPNRTAVVRTVVEMGLTLGAETFVAQAEALRRRRDLSSLLEEIAVPTLVMCGMLDRVCPPSRHELMAARIRGAELRLIDGAGHFPMLDAPDATTRALRRWLTDALVLS